MSKKTYLNTTKGSTNSNHLLKFGSYGFKLLSNLRLTEEQIVALRRLLLKKLKNLESCSKTYKIWELISLNKTLTKLPLESGMGKGKGSIYTKAVFLKKGFILYEFQNIKNQSITELFYFFRKYFPAKLLLINKK